MKTGEFAVIDNNGFVETGIKNQTKALKVVKDLKKSGKFVSGGNLTIVRVVASFDNFITGDSEHLGADGLPIAD